MNRSIQPEVKPIEGIKFTNPKQFKINGFCKMVALTDVPSETAKLDLYFDAGTCRGSQELVNLVNGMLLSGTKKLNSTEIQDAINAYGAFLDFGVSQENAVISIYALQEYLIPIARLIKEYVGECIFPQNEIEEAIADRKQKLLVSLEKVNVLAQRNLRQRLFAGNESYRENSTIEGYAEIDREQVISFYEDFYLKGLTKLIVVGQFSQDELDEIMDLFGDWAKETTPLFDAELKPLLGQVHIEKDGALQSAVRVVRPLFNKNHVDFLDFLVLNTLVGDYFGSRLMKNIREDKGYSYGIGSVVFEMNEMGYFLVATEVGKEVRVKTLEEIQYEFKRLQDERVPEDELDLVKNYMLGQLLKSADGPYSMMDLFISADLHGKDLEFYNDAIHAVNAISAERIQFLAKNYLNWEDFIIVTAG